MHGTWEVEEAGDRSLAQSSPFSDTVDQDLLHNFKRFVIILEALHNSGVHCLQALHNGAVHLPTMSFNSSRVIHSLEFEFIISIHLHFSETAKASIFRELVQRSLADFYVSIELVVLLQPLECSQDH